MHREAIQRILCYPKGTRDHVLTVGGRIGLSDSAYCHADHANSPDHGGSFSGYTILLGCGAIAWSAKKQTSATRLSIEPECCASVRVGQEVARLRHLLKLDFCLVAARLSKSTILWLHMITRPEEINHRNKYAVLHITGFAKRLKVKPSQ